MTTLTDEQIDAIWDAHEEAPTLSYRYLVTRAIEAAVTAAPPCIGKDPLCPCQDGDTCHYVATKKTEAWPAPSPALREAAQGALTVLELIAANRKGELMSNVETRHGSFVNVIDIILLLRAALAAPGGQELGIGEKSSPPI